MPDFEVRQSTVFARWIDRLQDERARLRIEARIRRLQYGNPGDVRPVGGGVSELRIDYGPGYRVYYVARGRMVILLLCGGVKASQAKDIGTARALADELRD